MISTTKIKGYEVTVDPYMDGAGASGCWVSRVFPSGFYCASLAALQDTGVLENAEGVQHTVPSEFIDEIAAYAEQKGY